MDLVGASRGLTDDVLTMLPRARSLRAYWRDGIDQLAGADPGLTQLRLAVQSVLGIGSAAGLAYLFVRATGAMQVAAGSAPPAAVAAHNHGVLIVGMLIAGIIAQQAGLQVTDQTIRGQVINLLWLPVPMLAAMSIGITIGRYRTTSLVFLVVLLSFAVWLRRFGRRGTATGIVMFNGGFLGFFLQAQLTLRDLGALAALLGIGIASSLLIRLLFFRPNLARTLRRMRRSWGAMASQVLDLCVDVLQAEAPDDVARLNERLRRRLIRLNECSLMIDAQIADSLSSGWAYVESQHLFDADLSLSNLARFTAVIGDRCPEREWRELAARCVAAVRYWDHEQEEQDRQEDHHEIDELVAQLREATSANGRMTVVVRRLGRSAAGYVRAREALRAAIAHREAGGDPAAETVTAVAATKAQEGTEAAEMEPFSPAVALTGGWLPGSAPVSTKASTTAGRGSMLDRVALQPYNRATIQAAVAATIAVVLGDRVSPSRLYWAVLATFLAFLATTNAGEQVRKAMFRAGGTAIGIVLGDLLVHATGGQVVWSFAIVLVSLFFGIYLIRVNYMFMVIAVTVTMSQLYLQFAEFSWHLLVLRLIETAIGVGSVVVTVLVVVPLRPQRVLITGTLLWFRELSQLVDHALDELTGAPKDPLRAEVRDLDAAYAALESTAAGLRRATFGRTSAQLADVRTISAAARNYARSLANGVMVIDLPANENLRAAAHQMRASMAAVEARLDGAADGAYVRSASLVELAASELHVEGSRAQLVLADLTLLDGTLARLAKALQMGVADYDTTTAEPAAAGATAADV